MNIFNNNRTIFWILIFLVLINTAALATYFFMISKPVTEPSAASALKRGFALRQELSLTPDQALKVNEINTTYRASSEPVVAKVREKKAELLDELSKENTDTAVVVKLTNEVLDEQKKLQVANIKQFLDLKKVCTPEQTQKLSQIYAELYGCEFKGQGRGQGNGNQMRHRHRYGQRQPDSSKPAE